MAKAGRPRKYRKKGTSTLLQAKIPPHLAQRFYASPEYRLHGSINAALRAILDKVLPRADESQEENGGPTENTPALAG